ncbi:MAG: L,D-transpeptidase [Puniceicoccaceae bacterium]
MKDPALWHIHQRCKRFNGVVSPELLLVRISSQSLTLLRNEIEVARYPVSTSKNPPSCRENSFGTPTGLHRIIETIGDRQPSGMVFRGRQPIGATFSQLPPEDQRDNLITSRILRLEGLEEGLNRGPGLDSFQRYIYIHGTNHEALIGTPSSGGCVQMRNADIIQLFPQISIGTLVWIE